MKLWTLAGLLTGIVIASFVVRKYGRKPMPMVATPDSRYTIDELIGDLEP